MDLEDLTAVLTLFESNVKKVQQNLIDYQHDVDAVRKSLVESWSHVARADVRIISIHDGLLSSVNAVNEHIIKLNLHINLNRPMRNLTYVHTMENICKQDRECLDHNNNKENHINGDGIDVGELDVKPSKSKESSPRTMDVRQLMQLKTTPVEEKLNSQNSSNPAEPKLAPVLPIGQQEISYSANSSSSVVQMSTPTQEEPKSTDGSNSAEPTLSAVLPISIEKTTTKNSANDFHSEQMVEPVLPISPRTSDLLPPKGGREILSNEVYDQVLKNMSNFPSNSIVQAKMMHMNIFEKCIFVAKWGAESLRLRQLLACEIPIKKLDQLPDFGEIFGVYDAQDQIILRVMINAYTEGGGYDAYLLDYGEHIHLNGKEVIFGLPDDVVALPAEAIRCYVDNAVVDYMRRFMYKDVRLRVKCNDGIELLVDLLEDEIQLKTPMDTSLKQEKDNKLSQSNEQDVEPIKSAMKLSPREMEMLEYNEPTTCDAVKAVLGFNPTDDLRICRYYDPKTGGCFKGSHCRLLHQPFAPHGATKDKELMEALPETQFESLMTRELGSVVRVVVTYINGPTQVFVQFVDESPALVWSKNDVPESERKFKRPPLPLDMVLGLYDDGYYYRAQIIEECNGVFKIFYVDYGNTEFVTIRSLAQCNNARSMKPHRAVSCFITGVQHVPSALPGRANECVEFLKSNLLNCEINVKLLSRLPDGYVIKLLDHLEDICDQMVEHGYMEIRTENEPV